MITEKQENIRHLVSGIINSLRHDDAPLTKRHLWDSVAATASPEWVQAKADLDRAEARLRWMEEDENVSLGLIGNALDFEETSQARNEHADRLARFTCVDESLHTDETLQRTFDTLRDHWSEIEASLAMAREMRDMTRPVEKIPPPASFSLKGVFDRFSKKTAEQSPNIPTPPAFHAPQTAEV